MVEWSEGPARDVLVAGALAVAVIIVPYVVLIPGPGAAVPIALFAEGANLDAGVPIWVVLLPLVASLVACTPLIAWRADMVDDEAVLDWFPFGRHVEVNAPVVVAGSFLFVSVPLFADLMMAVTAGLLPATVGMARVIILAEIVPPAGVIGLVWFLRIVPYQEPPLTA